MNPELGFKFKALLLWIWPCNWLNAIISHSCSAVLQAARLGQTCLQLKRAACLGQIYLQVKWGSHKVRVACPQGRKTPKLKVLQPRINILGLKNLNLLEIILSAARGATGPHTVGNKVNCSLCLHLQAKTAQKKTNQFPNRETDFSK